MRNFRLPELTQEDISKQNFKPKKRTFQEWLDEDDGFDAWVDKAWANKVEKERIELEEKLKAEEEAKAKKSKTSTITPKTEDKEKQQLKRKRDEDIKPTDSVITTFPTTVQNKTSVKSSQFFQVQTSDANSKPTSTATKKHRSDHQFVAPVTESSKSHKKDAQSDKKNLSQRIDSGRNAVAHFIKAMKESYELGKSKFTSFDDRDRFFKNALKAAEQMVATIKTDQQQENFDKQMYNHS